MNKEQNKVDRFSLRFYADDAIEQQIVETLKSLPSGRRQELMRGWLKQGFMMLNQITCPASVVVSKTVEQIQSSNESTSQDTSSNKIDFQEQGQIEGKSGGNDAFQAGDDETDEDDLIKKMKSLTGYSE